MSKELGLGCEECDHRGGVGALEQGARGTGAGSK